MQICFITCDEYPQVSRGDQLVKTALEQRGIEVLGTPWNAGSRAFQNADLIVFRSNWDYHRHLAAFKDWLNDIDQYKVACINETGLIRWNLSKDYLLELNQAGFMTPRSRVLQLGTNLEDVFDDFETENLVIKPLVGASGHGVTLLNRSETINSLCNWSPPGKLPYLVQEFLPQIENGELSLVYFNGQYSHCVLKQPQPGEFRINSQYRGKLSRFDPGAHIINAGRLVLEYLPLMPTYARVDGIQINNQLCICELELNEPSLYFTLAPDRAEKFADAIINKL